ncbi:hypothetical protein [Nannocystis pusilla]|uniref:hypothetical protein n=1 Tax=Nannocystis pusilla TaxID=889268 RepID=UPI003B75ECD9
MSAIGDTLANRFELRARSAAAGSARCSSPTIARPAAKSRSRSSTSRRSPPTS